jgi:hypothetical protein
MWTGLYVSTSYASLLHILLPSSCPTYCLLTFQFRILKPSSVQAIDTWTGYRTQCFTFRKRKCSLLVKLRFFFRRSEQKLGSKADAGNSKTQLLFQYRSPVSSNFCGRRQVRVITRVYLSDDLLTCCIGCGTLSQWKRENAHWDQGAEKDIRI